MLQLNAIPNIRKPENSPFVTFAKGTKERLLLEIELERIRRSKIEKHRTLPLWINGPLYTSNEHKTCSPPHDPKRILSYYDTASEEHVHKAIKTVLAAKQRWATIPFAHRWSIFMTAARLLETKYLIPMVAAVMEDYGKIAFEAFIDVQEMIDFWNFNVYFASQIYAQQADSNADGFNITNYRPLEGFVFASPPNNFLAIEGNLPSAPLIMGNVVICKPSSDVVYSFHLVLKILLEAGLPHDVLAVLHGNSSMIGEILTTDRNFAGVHFTGGTDVFESFFTTVGANIKKYREYPRIVGETGGKDPIVTFPDADPVSTALAIIVGGFGYQGQKCSATSRVYVEEEYWAKVLPVLLNLMKTIKVGDVADFRNYMSAVVSESRYKEIMRYVERALKPSVEDEMEAVYFGEGELTGNGLFIPPTVIVTRNPHFVTMEEEIFGPVVTVCKLPKKNYKARVLRLCDETSPYGLTGAVHTNNIFDFCEALDKLKYVAGNMYNWKTTGAMVAKQPFSGARKSGTNSKVGGPDNLRQWTIPSTLGITFVKPDSYIPACVDKE